MNNRFIFISLFGACAAGVAALHFTVNVGAISESSDAPMLPHSELVKTNGISTIISTNHVTENANLVQPQIEQVHTVSALESYPGFGHNIDRDEQTYSSEEAEREAIVTACMQSNGFEYTPSTSVLIDEDVLADAEAFEELVLEMSTDPNETYISSLTDTELRSYNMTLYGVEDPNDPEADAYDAAISSDSCISKSFYEIPGVYAKRNMLQDEFEQMETNVSEDSAVTNALEAWSFCMADSGFDVSSPIEVLEQTDQVLTLLSDSYEGRASANSDFNLDPSIMSIMANQSLDVDSKWEKSDVVLEEMRKTSNKCDVSSDLSRVRTRVRIDYENKFVEENIDQLE